MTYNIFAIISHSKMTTNISLSFPTTKSLCSMTWLCRGALGVTAALVPESRRSVLIYAATELTIEAIDRWIKWSPVRLASLLASNYALSNAVPYANNLSIITGLGGYVLGSLLSIKLWSLRCGICLSATTDFTVWACSEYVIRRVGLPVARVLTNDNIRNLFALDRNPTLNITAETIELIAPLKCAGLHNNIIAPNSPDFTCPVDCAVCQDKFTRTDGMYRDLPCGHPFHATCVDPWIILHRSCPICKRTIVFPANSPVLNTSDSGSTGNVGVYSELLHIFSDNA